MLFVSRLLAIRGADWPTQLIEKVNVFDNTLFYVNLSNIVKKESVYILPVAFVCQRLYILS